MLFRKVLFGLALGLTLTLTKAQSLRGNGKRILYRRSGHRQGCLTLNSNGTCEGNVTPVDLHDGEGLKCWVGGVEHRVCGGGHHGGHHGGNHGGPQRNKNKPLKNQNKPLENHKKNVEKQKKNQTKT